MATSELDICKLALSHLGDTANITSINPQDGSVQSALCQRFYPMARDALLEMHSWGFNTKRTKLSPLVNKSTEWDYCYAAPSDVLNVISVLPENAADDNSTSIPLSYSNIATINAGQGMYTPQQFSMEAYDDGTSVIYTNSPNATLRYNAKITDTTVFSPLFTTTLSWLLASYLAGPLVKGDAGAGMAQACYKVFLTQKGMATTSDANQRRINPTQSVPWMMNR